MKQRFIRPRGNLLILLLVMLAGSGCESTDSGASVSGGVYYGVGFHDPWYYGSGYYPPDVIVTPPNKPERPPHVEHPIVKPAPRPTPMPRPAPSIPSTPRPSVRR